MTGSRRREERAIWGTALQRIMTRPAVTVAPGTSLAEAAELMLDKGVGSLLVVDEAGRLTGILTDSDFAAKRAGIPFSTFRMPQVLGQWLGPDGVERVYREARRRTVGEIMSSPVHSVAANASVPEVLRLMLERDIKHVPVVHDGRPFGMIARHDLLKLMLETSLGSDAAPAGNESSRQGDDGKGR